MADHSILVGIGNGACLEFIHCVERFVQARPDLLKEILGEVHSAQVQSQPEGRELCVMTLEPCPKIFVACL
tara:strand:+ start:410 stop:622 length:213 start_codon:yes stop_codon:yes gene_type:complete